MFSTVHVLYLLFLLSILTITPYCLFQFVFQNLLKFFLILYFHHFCCFLSNHRIAEKCSLRKREGEYSEQMNKRKREREKERERDPVIGEYIATAAAAVEHKHLQSILVGFWWILLGHRQQNSPLPSADSVGRQFISPVEFSENIPLPGRFFVPHFSAVRTQLRQTQQQQQQFASTLCRIFVFVFSFLCVLLFPSCTNKLLKYQTPQHPRTWSHCLRAFNACFCKILFSLV